MFSFIKKKVDNAICSPVKGECLDISKSNDKIFSEKVLGDGFLIKPMEEIVCSPCDGKITMIFPTKHAFGIKMNNGQELLIHIGIDTINLNGEYFEQLSRTNTNVKKGTPIIKCNFGRIKEKGYDTSVLVILCGEQNVFKNHIGKVVNCEDRIIGGGYENNKKHK